MAPASPHRTHVGALLVFGAASMIAACAETGPIASPDRNDDPEAAADTGRMALLAVSSHTGTLDGVEPRVDVSGQFIAWDGPTADWPLHALDLWVPQPDANGGVDSCRVDLGPAETATELDLDPQGRIELLDAGSIVLARDVRSELVSFYVPDLQDQLSGVVYGLDEPVAYRSGAAYVFDAEGSTEIPPFNVTVAAPPEMRLTHVGELDRDETVPAYPLEEGELVLEWTPQAPSAAGADTANDELVYVDLYDDARSAAPVISCVVHDDGHFAIPAAALDDVRSIASDHGLRLVARRARAAAFDLPGFDWASAVFTTTDSVRLAR